MGNAVRANLPEQRTLPPRRPVQTYLQGDTNANPRVLLQWAVFDWSIIAAAWATMTVVNHLAVTVVGIIVVASRLHALGAILHDACHKRRRPASRMWWLVEALAGWPIASTIEAMRYHHLRHHATSGTQMDPYHGTAHAHTTWRRYVLTVRGIVLPFWWTLRACVAPFALVVPKLRTVYGRLFLQDQSGNDLQNNAAVVACAKADLAQLAGQTVVLGSTIAAELPILTYYLIPVMLAGILNARRVIYEHSWKLNDHQSRSQTWETTVDHDIGIIGNAVFYPHNIGLHRIHHMYPTVSFTRLRELDRALQKTARI